MKVTFRYQRLTILWALFIFVMCAMSFGGISGSPMFFPGFDKLVHCGLFFVLVIFWCNGFLRQQNIKYLPYKSMGLVLGLSILYGGIIEILQMTIFTWRSAELGDLFADTTGACMAIFSIVVIGKASGHEKN
jgi:VanZ family protein